MGNFKDQGDLAVIVAWKDERWNLELAKLFYPAPDALSIAVEINQKHRDRVTAAFLAHGLGAVQNVFHEF